MGDVTLTDAEREKFAANLRQNLGYSISPIIAQTLCAHVERIIADRLAAERERIAEAIESHLLTHGRSQGKADGDPIAVGLVEGYRHAARIARGQS